MVSSVINWMDSQTPWWATTRCSITLPPYNDLNEIKLWIPKLGTTIHDIMRCKIIFVYLTKYPITQCSTTQHSNHPNLTPIPPNNTFSTLGRMNLSQIMIQVDVGGHPPIPFGPPQLSLSAFSVSLIVAQLTIFSSFSGPKLPKPFWGPKRRFLGNPWETMIVLG